MIKVLTHGRRAEENYIVTCRNCDCIYCYTKDELKPDDRNELCTKCPECNYENEHYNANRYGGII